MPVRLSLFLVHRPPHVKATSLRKKGIHTRALRASTSSDSRRNNPPLMRIYLSKFLGQIITPRSTNS